MLDFTENGRYAVGAFALLAAGFALGSLSRIELNADDQRSGYGSGALQETAAGGFGSRCELRQHPCIVLGLDDVHGDHARLEAASLMAARMRW